MLKHTSDPNMNVKSPIARRVRCFINRKHPELRFIDEPNPFSEINGSVNIALSPYHFATLFPPDLMGELTTGTWRLVANNGEVLINVEEPFEDCVVCIKSIQKAIMDTVNIFYQGVQNNG